MSHPQTRRSSRAWRSVAVALLMLLLTAVFAPFATAQDGGSTMPACCRDAQHCSLHLHHAAQAAHDGYQLAAVQPRCPCVPLAPANGAMHDAAFAASAQTGFALETQFAHGLQRSAFHRWMHAAEDGTRGPPYRLRLV